MKPLPEWINFLFAESLPQKLLFRVDAGNIPGLSFGHISRCIMLDDCCRKTFSSDSLFLMRDYPEGLEFTKHASKKVLSIAQHSTNTEEKNFIIQALQVYQPDWIVHDLPYDFADQEVFQFCLNNNIHVLFMDDARFIAPEATVTLNSSMLATERVDKSRALSKRLLLGPDYFLYDFYHTVRHDNQKQVKAVLLTFGGSDPTDLTTKVLEALSNHVWRGISLQVMLGPGYQRSEYVKSIARNAGLTCEFIISPQDQIAYYRQADLIVCAGGRTMYELLALNIPFIPVASATHEAEAVEAFIKKGIILSGLSAWDSSRFINYFQKALSMYCNLSCTCANPTKKRLHSKIRFLDV